MATPFSDDTQRNQSRPFWFERIALDDVESESGPVRCRFCNIRDATRWNYHDTIGAVRHCDHCVEFVSADDDDAINEDIPRLSEEIWDATLAFIQQHQPVTFTQLIRFLATRGVPVKGSWMITNGCITREFYWADVSPEVMNLVMSLNMEGDIWYEPTTVETYIIDSGTDGTGLPESEDGDPVLIVAGYMEDD